MVLELANICLRSICDGIKQGQIHGYHLGLLPPYDPKMSLRQRVLDWVLLNGTINNPNCLAALSSVKFLDGMTSLSTWKSRGNDSEYLIRLANTLRSASKSGDTIGSKITSLHLVMVHNSGIGSQNRCVAHVIGECPNLEILSRRVAYFGGHFFTDPFAKVLSGPEFQSCRKIIEGVSELSIVLDKCLILDGDFLSSSFTNLRSLRICGGINVEVKGDAWLALMESVKNTLITLYVDKLRIYKAPHYSVLDNLLPFPMSHLRDLTIVSFFANRQFRLSLDILRQCRDLNNFLIPITYYSSQEVLSVVNSLPNVDVGVSLFLSDEQNPPLLLTEPPRFRLVDWCKEKITYVRFEFVNWNLEYEIAFEQFVETCPHLSGFEFLASTGCGQVDLSALFDNDSRARQLCQVVLSGDIIFGNLFQNCVGLESLRLVNNLDVCDNDLTQWAQQGGRLSEIEIDRCSNVGQDGLVALLVASGSKLRKLQLSGFAYSKDRVLYCLEQYCPVAETVCLA